MIFTSKNPTDPPNAGPGPAAPGSDVRPGMQDILAAKKRGRPSKAEEVEKIKAELSQSQPVMVREIFKPDMVEGITNLPFSLAAMTFKNPGWNLAEEDKKFISPALADWLNELWPEITGKYPRLAVLCVMTSSVFIKKAAELHIQAQREGKSPVPKAPPPPKKDEPIPTGGGLTDAERFLKNRTQQDAA